jgi:hypothetical protein
VVRWSGQNNVNLNAGGNMNASELLELVRKIRDIDYNIELTDDDKSNRILSLVADAYRLGQTDAYNELYIIQ